MAINHNAGQHGAIMCVANRDALLGQWDLNIEKEELAIMSMTEGVV